jgi:hypothetical protein
MEALVSTGKSSGQFSTLVCIVTYLRSHYNTLMRKFAFFRRLLKDFFGMLLGPEDMLTLSSALTFETSFELIKRGSIFYANSNVSLVF